jgi:hypothetical protein
MDPNSEYATRLKEAERLNIIDLAPVLGVNPAWLASQVGNGFPSATPYNDENGRPLFNVAKAREWHSELSEEAKAASWLASLDAALEAEESRLSAEAKEAAKTN